jgi:glycosyltransferase involved in cell wall biosynthesis
MNMLVVHLLRKLDPAAWGGTEMAIQRLFDGLRAQGVCPVVYCPRLEGTSAGEPMEENGYQVKRFKAFLPILGLSKKRKRQLISVGGNLMSFDLVRSLRREKNVSLIHTHTLGRIGGIALTMAKERRVPFVVSIHGGVFDLPAKIKASFETDCEGGWEWGKLFGLLYQSHNLFRDADAILTCNQNEAAKLQRQFPGKRIAVQPHGVPMELYRQDQRPSARAAFPQLCNRQLLLCLGRVDPVKNQAWLLDQASEIFRKHPRALLVFAGACTDEPYGELIGRRITQLGLENRVLLTGGLPPNDPRLIGLIQEAQLLLLPSLSETFGLVILEAWAAGTVTVASRTSGASALLEHGSNGWLFDLDQPDSFHQAVDLALSQPELLRPMAERGAEKVALEYSVSALAARMRALYLELIEQKRSRQPCPTR